ncbi:ACS family MFS transporter [Parahaliea mediterranea]|uniref:ACS family MFS transporter n=1 Tax=Parahaliea mediterranea TaxID=651086 RepID=A0A939IMZ2_9GAMM|nr:ACS family MFS transporter [Parahaliea mediterranea]MBN7797507.1 ACS family MFS transporter [Parahaliea mediterranea]
MIIALATVAVVICYIDRVNMSVAVIPMAAEFGWDARTQGMVLSSFFFGYMLTQVAGGWLADRYGGALVLGVGVVFWSICTIVAPAAANFSLFALIASRVLMGLGEAVTFPSIYSLFARIVPAGQVSGALATSTSGIPLGTVVALLLTPLIIIHLGWEWSFYLYGAMGIVWCLAWKKVVKAADSIDVNVNEEVGTCGEEPAQQSVKMSTKAMLSRASVWAIIMATFSNNWTLYVLLAWLPTFVTSGLGVEFSSVGIFSVAPYIVSFIFLNVAGKLADHCVQRGIPVRRVRVAMQVVSGLGYTITLLVVGHAGSAVEAIAIISIGCAFGACSAGGFGANHIDIAPRQAGTLLGIANTFGTLPGIVGVYVSGAILQATNSWTMVFTTAAVIMVVGTVFYCCLASCDELAGSGRA